MSDLIRCYEGLNPYSIGICSVSAFSEEEINAVDHVLILILLEYAL